MHLFVVFVLIFFALLNVGCAVIQVGLLRRRPGWSRGLAAFIVLWAAVIVGLLLFQFLVPGTWKPWTRHWLYFPLSTEMVWNLLFVQIYFLGLVLIALGLRFFRPVAKKEKEPVDAPGLSRRNFIYAVACGAAPAAAMGMGLHGALTRYDLRVRDFRIAIAGLPAELEGFTIAHVSDLHSGIYCGPKRLKIIGEAVNDLKADLITITGDIINSNIDEFNDALVTIRGMRARQGIYLCEGNHDLLAGPGVIGAACAANGLPWLYNSCVVLPVRGRRLVLAGLPWINRGFAGRTDIVSNLYPARQDGDVRILMAHHPHLFDIADSADLVLSGHTHGGQIMADEEVGLGPLFFKYWSGFYHRDETSMVVSNGCGDWFPCRIGAPAEIGLIHLTAG